MAATGDGERYSNYGAALAALFDDSDSDPDEPQTAAEKQDAEEIKRMDRLFLTLYKEHFLLLGYMRVDEASEGFSVYCESLAMHGETLTAFSRAFVRGVGNSKKAYMYLDAFVASEGRYGFNWVFSGLLQEHVDAGEHLVLPMKAHYERTNRSSLGIDSAAACRLFFDCLVNDPAAVSAIIADFSAKCTSPNKAEQYLLDELSCKAHQWRNLLEPKFEAVMRGHVNGAGLGAASGVSAAYAGMSCRLIGGAAGGASGGAASGVADPGSELQNDNTKGLSGKK
jgi:hypothetical protein